jgi:hypothetical protein
MQIILYSLQSIPTCGLTLAVGTAGQTAVKKDSLILTMTTAQGNNFLKK